MFDLWHFLIILGLGCIQGVTEVLPISSSGHLKIAETILSLDTFNLELATVLHAGSLLAIVFWFHRELGWIWLRFRKSIILIFDSWQNGTLFLPRLPNNYKMPYFLAFSMVPIGVVGFFFQDSVRSLFTNSQWTPVFLVANGLIVIVTARSTTGDRTLEELTLKDYLIIGIIHCFGIVPGLSRLGMTLCAGLFRRLNWFDAVRLSFILAIPAILGSLILNFSSLSNIEIINGGGTIVSLIGIGASMLAATFTSWFALKFLINHSILERRSLYAFGVYCIFLGVFSTVYIQVF